MISVTDFDMFFGARWAGLCIEKLWIVEVWLGLEVSWLGLAWVLTWLSQKVFRMNEGSQKFK